MEPDRLFERYRECQRYLNWSHEDVARVRMAAPILSPHLESLVDDFYQTLQEHQGTRAVLTGGEPQIARLRGSLRGWLRELLGGEYDRDYVTRRWRVGRRHVEIGLSQVYTNVALARLRVGISNLLERYWSADLGPHAPVARSLNTLLDLDLAIIEDAYQTEYQARVQSAERFATLGQVAGGVAHELRNPLNVIKTSVYYLTHARAPSPEKCAEHYRRIERHVELADRVITALSNFAKMPLPHAVPVDIGHLIRDVIDTHPLPETIQFVSSIPRNVPSVLADQDQLRIVLGNLIRNAMDAMPEGGSLSIVVHSVRDGVEVEVSDTGVGIAPDQLSRIMEPLYSTKARGLGLGLAIARSILEKSRGELTVQSQLGLGSVFTVRLPCSPHVSGEVP